MAHFPTGERGARGEGLGLPGDGAIAAPDSKRVPAARGRKPRGTRLPSTPHGLPPPGKYIIQGISSCSLGMLRGGVSTSLFTASRGFFFLSCPGADFPSVDPPVCVGGEGTHTAMLPPGTRSGTGRKAVARRGSVSWVSAPAAPVSGRLIASGVEPGASWAQPGGHGACAPPPAPPPWTPLRVFLPLREGRSPRTAPGPSERESGRAGFWGSARER